MKIKLKQLELDPVLMMLPITDIRHVVAEINLHRKVHADMYKAERKRSAYRQYYNAITKQKRKDNRQ